MGRYKVYKHTSPSGKVYIGITKQKPEYRWRDGRGYRYNPHFARAIDFYGWDAFHHEIIATNLERPQAAALEVELIAKYDSTNPQKGYNLSTGGDCGAAGVKRNEDYCKRLSESRMGHPVSPATREKLSAAITGKHHSTKTRQKLREQNGYGVLCVESGAVFASTKEAAAVTGADFANIAKACAGKRLTAGGCHWQYINPKNKGGL